MSATFCRYRFHPKNADACRDRYFGTALYETKFPLINLCITTNSSFIRQSIQSRFVDILCKPGRAFYVINNMNIYF